MGEAVKDWQPVTELEFLLDALEAELLAVTDEEIRDALGRRQPARGAVLAISDATAFSDTIGWPPGVTSLHAFDRHIPSGLWPREH